MSGDPCAPLYTVGKASLGVQVGGYECGRLQSWGLFSGELSQMDMAGMAWPIDNSLRHLVLER